MTARFVLASASPARRRTLRNAGVLAQVIVSDVDEDAVAATLPHATTAELAQALAEAKAHAVAAGLDGPALVLGCDSILDLEGEALGKPENAEVAVARWQRMRGKRGTLHTGHCLIDLAAGHESSATVSTVVHFADITDEEIAAYCASGEPTTVAGAFTIDGYGGWFVEGVEGDPHNVVGLSLPTLRRMLRELGHSLTDLGYPA